MLIGKEYIKDSRGFIIGSVETQDDGDKTVKDERGFVLGYYKKSQNNTVDYRGFIVARGDSAVSLIYKNLYMR